MSRRTDDRSPGDAREPYSDIGGPAGRHAQTHDVRQEELTNPKGPDHSLDEFADDLAPVERPDETGGHVEESAPAGDDRSLAGKLDALSTDEIARLAVLEPGTRLDQGGTYLDLNDIGRGPFKAIGGHEAREHNRYVAKRDTDYELWNRLVGDDAETRVERPTED